MTTPAPAPAAAPPAPSPTVRLMCGEIGVEVAREVLIMPERVQLKTEAYENKVRWCPYDYDAKEAAGDATCKYGGDCVHAHVKAAARADVRAKIAKETERIRAVEAEEGGTTRTMNPLWQFRIILVDPQDSRNIGSVSRLSANYGIDDVWVVSRRQLDWDEARAKRVRSRQDANIGEGENAAAPGDATANPSPPRKKVRTDEGPQAAPSEPAPKDTAAGGGGKKKDKKNKGGGGGGAEAFRPEDLDERRQRNPMFNTYFWRYSEMLATPEGLPVLKGFNVVGELEDALKGVDKAIAFTGKRGVNFRTSTVDVPKLAEFAETGRVALVFGNEAKGLTSNDTLLCGNVCTLPTSSYCTSLNLSHSVTVVVSRLFEIFNGTTPPSQGKALPAHVPAPDGEVASVFEHCRQALAAQGYPAAKEDWNGGGRRRNKFAFRCHKHATSLLHLAQRANASSQELVSIKRLVTLLTRKNGEGADVDGSDAEDDAPQGA